MCIRKFIEGIVADYINSHPHPVANHSHDNYYEKKDAGYIYFGNSDEVAWNTSVNGVSTTIYVDVKTVL